MDEISMEKINKSYLVDPGNQSLNENNCSLTVAQHMLTTLH